MPESTSLIGQIVSHYRIIEKLGSGGMGVVYKAEDVKLGRLVALKFLPEDAAEDSTARERLVKEAQNASALNHPNIATIYEVEESDGQTYIAMELVEGRTLNAAVPRDGLAEQSALRYGAEIASALAHAHERGIIHRDLKPANVMITPEGHVKVLDFGLAKRVSKVDLSQTRSQLSFAESGAIVGTLQYMAPETLRGEPADPRTDLWAAGAVLYEMLLGTPAFNGRSAFELTSAILRENPKPLPRGISTGIQAIVQRCMAKDRDQRYQHAGEVRAALEAISSASNAGGRATRLWHEQFWAWSAAGAAILGLLAWGGFAFFHSKLAPRQTVSSEKWVQLTDFADSAVSPALSPDGRILAFIRGTDTFFGPGQIEAKVLPDGEPVQLTHDATAKMSPQFSLDGSTIAYTAAPLEAITWQWSTWTVPVLGGGAHLMLPNAEGLSWIDPNHVLFSRVLDGYHMAIAISNADGSNSRFVYAPPRERGMAHRSALSPDKKWVLVAEMDNGGWLPCRLVPFDGSSVGHPVGPSGAACTYAAWSPDGRWMYFSSNAGGRFHIWRQRFPNGNPEKVTSGGGAEEGIAVAPDGESLITSVGNTESTVWVRGAHGERQISSEGYATAPEFSHNGKKLFYTILRNGEGTFARQGGELWVADLASGQSERLLGNTLVTGYDISPDDTEVVYSANDREGLSHLWLASLDSGFPPREFASSVDEDRPFWVADGDIYFRAAEGKSNFLYRMKPDGSERAKALPKPIFELGAVSPDGRWAIVEEGSDPQGVAEPLQGGTPIPICKGFCDAGWSRDGRVFDVYVQLMDGMRTVAATLAPGRALPDLPPEGLNETNLDHVGNAKVLRGLDFPGPPGESAFFHEDVHRNLFRVSLQ